MKKTLLAVVLLFGFTGCRCAELQTYYDKVSPSVRLMSTDWYRYVENDPTLDANDKAVRKGFMDEALSLDETTGSGE